MKTLKQAASLLLAAAMLLGVLSGCGGGSAAADPVREVLGYSRDTTFFTVNGERIKAEDYLLWLVQEIEYLNGYYMAQGGGGVNWDEDLDGITAKEFLKQQALETAKFVCIIRQTGEAEGFRYEAEDETAYAEERAQVIQDQGGQEIYDRSLLEMCMTDTSMEKVDRANTLSRKMLEGLFAEGGAYAPSEASIQEELEARSILRAQHILLLTTEPDLDAKPYSDAKIAEQRALAGQLLALIRESSDPAQTFESLMHEYSEDTGLIANPDGYVFTPEPDGVLFTSRMVESFEQGTRALQIGEISDVVESEYGLHIIRRLDPAEDATFHANFLTAWNRQRLDQIFQDAMNSAEVETTSAFDELDAQSFYEGLLEYRARLNGLDATTPPEEETEEDGTKDGTEGE